MASILKPKTTINPKIPNIGFKGNLGYAGAPPTPLKLNVRNQFSDEVFTATLGG
jgi:hypothetical protein